MTIADRLTSARHARFVGRRAELGLFDSALRAPAASFAVLFVHGPGGVGKTALLHAFADRALAAGVEPVMVDGRDTEPTPDGFLAALDRQPARPILLVDAYELLDPIDSWLRHTLVPQLPGHAIVVIAGRKPPSRRWRSDPGWTDLMQVVALANLPARDARSYLAAAGVAAPMHDEIVDLTDGHPLALSLVVDVLARRAAGTDLPLFHAPDVVRLLLEHFVEDVPTPEHRAALDMSALARRTTHHHVRAAVGRDSVDDLFDWLRQLSFVRDGRRGLYPHDLAREVLAADVRWRDPGRYRALMRTLLRTTGDQMRSGEAGDPPGEALVDLQFTFRTHPTLNRYWNFGALGDLQPQAPRRTEHDAVLRLIRDHDGDDHAELASRWLDLQPGGFRVDHGARGEIESVVGWLDLTAATAASPADVAADPITRLMWGHVQANGPPAEGEVVTAGRFLCPSAEPGDRQRLTALASYELLRRALRQPNLTWDFVALRQPDWWAPLLEFCGYERIGTHEADGASDGAAVGVFGHDWRTWPGFLARFLDEQDWREVRSRPVAALPLPAFEAAVRQALRDLHRPTVLAHNPLAAAVGVDGDGLAELLAEAARSLRSHPRDEKLYRALDRTYFRPAPTQERAAELLGLPSSTYRRHLAQGIARVAAWLEARATGS